MQHPRGTMIFQQQRSSLPLESLMDVFLAKQKELHIEATVTTKIRGKS